MARKAGATAPPATVITGSHGEGGTVAAAEGGGTTGAVGSSVAAAVGTATGQGFAVGYNIGHREIAARVQRSIADEQARAAGGKARHAPLADARRPHIERYWQRRDEGMSGHDAEKAALREMRAAGIAVPKSVSAIQRLLAREKR
jgi:hypothetical protein